MGEPLGKDLAVEPDLSIGTAEDLTQVPLASNLWRDGMDAAALSGGFTWRRWWRDRPA